MARKNQRPLWYSNLVEAESSYVRDKDGNIVYESIDGELVPVETGKSGEEYTKPVMFYGTLQGAGGEAEAAAYGVAVGSYQAKILDVVGCLPIKEMSLIYVHDPSEGDAEYRVVAVPIALNQVVYLLRRSEGCAAAQR